MVFITCSPSFFWVPLFELVWCEKQLARGCFHGQPLMCTTQWLRGKSLISVPYKTVLYDTENRNHPSTEMTGKTPNRSILPSSFGVMTLDLYYLINSLHRVHFFNTSPTFSNSCFPKYQLAVASLQSAYHVGLNLPAIFAGGGLLEQLPILKKFASVIITIVTYSLETQPSLSAHKNHFNLTTGYMNYTERI